MSLEPWVIFVLFSFPFFVTNKFFRYLVLLTATTTRGHHHHHHCMRGKRDDNERGEGRYTHNVTHPTPTSICSLSGWFTWEKNGDSQGTTGGETTENATTTTAVSTCSQGGWVGEETRGEGR
jgi:hypothetical protein